MKVMSAQKAEVTYRVELTEREASFLLAITGRLCGQVAYEIYAPLKNCNVPPRGPEHFVPAGGAVDYVPHDSLKALDEAYDADLVRRGANRT